MWYRVHLNRVHFNPLDKEGKLIRVLSSGPTFNCTTESDLELELLYLLAEPKSELMQFVKSWTEQDNAWYQLVFTKLSNASRAGFTGNKKVFTYMGYTLCKRVKDHIIFETKYMHIGKLNSYNIGANRDVREEVRNTNNYKVPGGEKIKKDWVEENGGI